MDPAALKFLLDEIGRLFDEQNAKWDARFSQWNAKREPEPYLGHEDAAEEVATSDLREAHDLEREEVEHSKLHEDRSKGAADAGREVALAAHLLVADACAARIVNGAAPFDSYVPAYAAQFDGFDLDHAAFLSNGANSDLMGSAFFKEREEANKCMPSQDKLVIDLDPPNDMETSFLESALHDVLAANYMEALTTCSTPGITERAMDELIRMTQAGERLWVHTGGREVLHIDTYDSIFAKPGGSFLSPDVHVDARFDAPPSRSGHLPSGCFIADMGDGSSKVT
jgi:diadenosine tetraphosphatase ApaH/serine/threonine PP2A family protein phosphatase